MTTNATAHDTDFATVPTAVRIALVQAGVEVGDKLLQESCETRQVLDLLGKVLLAQRAELVVESPSDPGALEAFSLYEPRLLELESDDDGLRPASLERHLQAGARLVYAMPDFQNPTGRTLSLERRHQVADLLRRYDTLLIEDAPYRALRYEGETLPTLKQLAPEQVVLVGASLNRPLPRTLNLYRARRDALLRALDRHMPEGFLWHRPEGGMFVWVEGPAGFDAATLQREAVARGVAIVAGEAFSPLPGFCRNAMRLNFTHASEEKLEEGVRLLAELLASSERRITGSRRTKVPARGASVRDGSNPCYLSAG